MTAFRVAKRAMMVESAVAEQAGQHRERAAGQHAIDERLLTLQRLRGGAAGEWALALRGIHNRGKEFRYGPQARPALAIDRVQRLAEDELTVAGVVAQIQPLCKRFCVYV